MNTMNNLAQGILLGDGAVATYLELATKKRCGYGLFHETTKRGYRRMNTNDNFPRMTSYYYIQQKLRDIPIESKRYFGGNIVNAPNVDGLEVGWAYTSDINRYKFKRGYSSVAYFNQFQNLLREEKWLKNSYNIISFNNYRGDNEAYDNIEETMKKNFVGERYFKYEKNFTKENPKTFSRGNFLDIKNIFKSFLPENSIIRNSAISKYGNDNSLNGFLVNNDYGKENSLYENEGKRNISSLFELSSMYSEDLISILYENKYNPLEKQYAFSQGEGDVINYYINLKKEKGVFNIDKDKGGKLTTINYNNGIKTYAFYDERETEGLDINNIREINTIDNSVFKFSTEGINSSSASKLIKNTNKIFNEVKTKTLINRFHTDTTDIDNEFITSKTQFGLSRGRNLLKKEYEKTISGDKTTGYDNPYCRVWTAHHQYSKMKDRIRPFINDETGNFTSLEELHSKLETLRPNNAPQRLSAHSVLQPNGFIKMTSAQNESGEWDGIQNYMFSIENLAWKDVNKDGVLSKEQIGPNKGRIMWFPPYNLKFSENINVNWNGNNFIGRGEQIYTYTNTERSGTLDFTLLIDHPSILNKMVGRGADYEQGVLKDKENEIFRFFAGCGEIDINKEQEKVNSKDNKKEIGDNKNTKPTPVSERIAYIIFFPNNYSGFDNINKIDNIINDLNSYEMSTSGDFKGEMDASYREQHLSEENKINKSKFNLNTSGSGRETLIKETLSLGDIKLNYFSDLLNISSEDEGDTLFGYLKTNTKIKYIEYFGFASSHGYEKSNIELCKRRANTIKNIVEKKCSFIDSNISLNFNYNEIEMSDKGSREDVNTLEAKIARAAVVVFNIERDVDSIPVNTQTSNSLEGIINGGIIPEVTVYGQSKRERTQENVIDIVTTSNFDDEFLYFKEISKDAYLVKNIINRVKHFDPAFHSITPEGFNSRLTFLQQCTRQGPTTAVNGGSVGNNSNDYLKFAGNLSFGRAPYCILRIGDFFNTKICIESISINYDNGGVQWDLNPEGAGVQPMMANISISFKFLGGQDISGPVERLQNAVTSNYYANASIYDYNADYGFKKGDTTQNVRQDVVLNN